MRAHLCLNNYQVYCRKDYAFIFFHLLEFEQNVRNYACHIIQNIQPGEKTKGDSSIIKKN